MAIDGIKSNKLVSDLLEGKFSNVPVGQTVLTNSEIPDNAKPETFGEEITTLVLDQFVVPGVANNSKTAHRSTSANSVVLEEAVDNSDQLIVEGAFDETTGSVLLVRANGDIVEIPGLLTQGDFGVGPQGVRGARGLDGTDGFEGREGKTGTTGCAGTQGNQGDPGDPGPQGPDGPPGIPGPAGQDGVQGVQGPQGKQGRQGFEGARGPRGPTCADRTGARGVDGQTPKTSVVISSTEPDALTMIWGVLE